MENREKLSPEQLQKYMQDLLAKGKAAQKQFEMNYLTNRAVDEVVRAIGMAACEHADELGEDSVAETNMGNLNDKTRRIHSTAHMEWAITRGRNTVDYEDSPGEPGVRVLPKPMGVIGCVMPSTTPADTLIGNAMMALKSRNAVIIAPHPSSVNTSVKMVNYLRDALTAIGAPADLIQCIGVEAASREATNMMMTICDCNISTGGAGRVTAAYSSGKPAFGVGQGNCQEIVDRGLSDSELEEETSSSIRCRASDNGVPCAGEQTAHVPSELLGKWLDLMQKHGAYLIDDDAGVAKIRELSFPGGTTKINRKIVGRLPHEVGAMCGIDIPESAKVILLKNQAWGEQDVLCREMLFPIIRYTTYEVFEDAVDRAVANLMAEGAGHTSTIWSHDEAHIEYAAKRIPVGRFHINQPTFGKNHGLYLTTTVACGTWGGNSISENLTYRHLLNKTKVTVSLPNRSSFMDASWDDFEPFNPLIEE